MSTVSNHREPEPPARAGDGAGDRSLREHLADFTTETVDLFRKEVELAKAEAKEKMLEAKSAATMFFLGGGLLGIGLLLMLVAGILLLSEFMAPWQATLIVATPAVIIGGIAVAKARNDFDPDRLAPRRWLASLRRDKKLIEEHV